MNTAQSSQARPVVMPRTAERNESKTSSKTLVQAKGTVDYALLLVVVILICIGIVMVLSSSYMTTARSAHFSHNPFFFFTQHVVWVLVGTVGLIVAWFVPYTTLRSVAIPFYLITVGFLTGVLFVGFATNGATRWIPFGPIQFQPSELARPAVIFLLAMLIERFKNMATTLHGNLILFGFIMVPALLIIYAGGMSITIIVVVVGAGIIAICSPFFKWYLLTGGLAGTLVAAYLFVDYTFGLSFRGQRFGAWLDPFQYTTGTGWQVIQSLYAIASGGWFGLGVGQSRQATFIPESHNDMIFAVIIEEIGVVGASLVVLLFALLIWRGIVIALRAPNLFCSITALGITLAFGVQAFINMAVVTNLIPNTGVNLPFISYGGTSLVTSMGMVGVLLSISRFSMKKT